MREPDGFCLLWEVREDISVGRWMGGLESDEADRPLISILESLGGSEACPP